MASRYDDPEYQKRLHTFSNFRSSAKSAAEMAAGKFNYAGQGDAVTCPECNLQLDNWVASDPYPLELHAKLSPDCPLLRPPSSDGPPPDYPESTDEEVEEFVKQGLGQQAVQEILLGMSGPETAAVDLSTQTFPNVPTCEVAEVEAALREYAALYGVEERPKPSELMKLILDARDNRQF